MIRPDSNLANVPWVLSESSDFRARTCFSESGPWTWHQHRVFLFCRRCLTSIFITLWLWLFHFPFVDRTYDFRDLSMGYLLYLEVAQILHWTWEMAKLRSLCSFRIFPLFKFHSQFLSTNVVLGLESPVLTYESYVTCQMSLTNLVKRVWPKKHCIQPFIFWRLFDLTRSEPKRPFHRQPSSSSSGEI